MKKVNWDYMKKALFLGFIFALSAALFFAGCSGCGGKNGSSTNDSTNGQTGPDLSLIKIKIGDKVNLDSPEKFVEVFILFNYEYIKWVKEINSDTNLANTGEEFLSKKRGEFYKSLGLTEDIFSQYGSAHFKEIDAFLEQHPDYKKAYDDSLKLIY